MSQYYYGDTNIEVLCPRDAGFNRTVNVRYHLPYTGGDLSNQTKLYVSATCKFKGNTETCTKCLRAVVNVLNSDDTFFQGVPLLPNF